MNTYYHYEYLNGTQFTTFANWTILCVYLKRKGVELPKLIGRWNIKLKNNNENDNTKNKEVVN